MKPARIKYPEQSKSRKRNNVHPKEPTGTPLIPFRFKSDRQLALDYARELGDAAAVSILEAGAIGSAAEARALARFYWRMVDVSAEEDIEAELENLCNAFSACCYQAGFSSAWHDEIPGD